MCVSSLFKGVLMVLSFTSSSVVPLTRCPRLFTRSVDDFFISSSISLVSILFSSRKSLIFSVLSNIADASLRLLRSFEESISL
ncbi:hypothetical protein D9M69_542500 [compost metagenome]